MRKVSVLAFLVALPTFALANGAMGLGLEQWDLNYWFAYVVATVVFEGWYIGKRLGLPSWRGLSVSILANLFTGVLCAGGGLLAPFLHSSFVGSSANPNPLLNAVALLAIFAIPSGLFEYLFWRTMLTKGSRSCSIEDLFKRTMVAHLLVIPLGMVILLVPDRPYRGLEAVANSQRRWRLSDFRVELDSYIQEHSALPTATNFEELLREIPSTTKMPDADPRWLMFYKAQYERFDTGETRRLPFRLNTALAGKHVAVDGEFNEGRAVWYLQPPLTNGPPVSGIKVDPVSGATKLSRATKG